VPRSPDVPDVSSTTKLDDLRARLDALLVRSRAKLAVEREAQAARVEARLASAPLPFETIETRFGPLHRRRVIAHKNERIGRVELDVARTVSSEALASLALDRALADCAPRAALYLDTETTGLAGGTGTIPFLIGLAWFEDDALVLEQLLLRRYGDEAPMLARVVELLSRASMLVTFNGKSFDWPLLRTRLVMNRMPVANPPPHLDLVHVARRIHRVARATPKREAEAPIDEIDLAGSCKLTSLERTVLGFEREGDIPSGEIPARFSHFLRTGDADAIEAVCDHNLWDVRSMVALVAVYADAVARLDDVESLLDDAASLAGPAFVGVAKTLSRAGDPRRARAAANRGVEATRDDSEPAAWSHARKTRSTIAKRARDAATAIDDLREVTARVDDPRARLELAKLLEHQARDPAAALAVLDRGVDEPAEAIQRRRARLLRKLERLINH
jgi:uncharacterized protein YprB with RNaseH-like and TPR domain